MSTDRNVGAKSVKSWKQSAHHGAGEWLAERGTSLVLIPLTLWAAYAAFTVAGGGFDAAVAFARVPLNAGLIGLTMLISVWHMYMGIKVIVDDYLQGGLRGFTMFLNILLSAALLIATGYALFVLHQGA